MFSRLWNLIKGMFGVFVGGLESRNPQAMLEAEKDNISQQLVNFNAGLVNQAAMIEGQTRQIKELEQQVQQGTVHVNSYAKAGDMATAGKLALQLQTAQTQLRQLIEQRNASNIRLRELEASRDAAFTRVRAKMGQLQQMVNETQMLEAQTDLEVSAKSMVDSTSTSLNNLDKVGGCIANLHDKAVGRARITAGQSNNMDLFDETQKQLESSALQQFLSMNVMGPVLGRVEEKKLGPDAIVVPSRTS
jgi:phage shock protein A